MKAITLTQPWASLVAIQAKKIETRSWKTNYRGPLAIHAGKYMNDIAFQVCYDPLFQKTLSEKGIRNRQELPLGAIVAICKLVDVVQITRFTELPLDPEYSFGSYAWGRYMFMLEDIKRLPNPIPARGALNLWEWNHELGTDT